MCSSLGDVANHIFPQIRTLFCSLNKAFLTQQPILQWGCNWEFMVSEEDRENNCHHQLSFRETWCDAKLLESNEILQRVNYLKCGMLCSSHGENAWDSSPAGGSCQHCSRLRRAVQACSSRAGSQLGTSSGLFHVQNLVLVPACECLSVGGNLFAPFHEVPAPLKLGNEMPLHFICVH